jgi:hypothetical protein
MAQSHDASEDVYGHVKLHVMAMRQVWRMRPKPPVGTDAWMRAEILSYSRSRGVFASPHKKHTTGHGSGYLFSYGHICI